MKKRYRMSIVRCWFPLVAAVLISTGCGREKTPAGDAPSKVASKDTTPAEKNHDEPAKRELIIFHAGSLSIPFKEISALFEKRNPGVEVKAEAAGSRDTARKVSDLGRPCDILGSADYKVVENLLMPEHAEFNVRFATNEMTIAYTDKSNRANEVTAENWHDILLDDGVIFGRADPNSDPCGYRTVMLFQLAEKHNGVPGLAEKLTAKGGGKYIRPKETDLLSLLEAREIDYLPIYRSVAVQHGLKFIELPEEMNLRSAKMEDLYAQAIVQITGKEPGEMVEHKGAPIVYSVTIPKNAPSRDLAQKYLELVLSEDGRRIMDKNGQTPLTPARSNEIDALPKNIATLVKPPEDSP